MKPVLQRLMVVLVIVAFSFQGASGAMQRLLMPAHYHAAPAVENTTAVVPTAWSDPHAHEEVSRDLEAHGGPGHLQDHHGREHEEDRLCDPNCERPPRADPATHPRLTALATGHASHVDVDSATHVPVHAHASVRAHRHDHGGGDVVLVAEEVETPASALRQHGLEGLWSLLPERVVLAVAATQDPVPTFALVMHRALARSAPRRPPRP